MRRDRFEGAPHARRVPSDQTGVHAQASNLLPMPACLMPSISCLSFPGPAPIHHLFAVHSFLLIAMSPPGCSMVACVSTPTHACVCENMHVCMHTCAFVYVHLNIACLCTFLAERKCIWASGNAKCDWQAVAQSVKRCRLG